MQISMGTPATTIVLVEPKTPGNVGAVARAMDNFGLEDMVLVNPCELNDEAYQRATHGGKILDNARIHSSMAEAVKNFFVVGTTGYVAKKEKTYHRMNKTPRELKEDLEHGDIDLAIVFGREDIGLLNEELNLCDTAVTIPTNPKSPVMNISHSVAVILYELYSENRGMDNFKRASSKDISRMMDEFTHLLLSQNYPPHRIEHTTTMFKRLLGRASPTAWDYSTLMGIFKRASHLSWIARGINESQLKNPSQFPSRDKNEEDGWNPDGDHDYPQNP